MKSAYVSFIFMFVIISMLIINQSIFKSHSDEMLIKLEEMRDNADKGDIDKAKENMLEFNSLLDKYKPFLTLTVRHDEIERIDEAATKTIEYLHSNSMSDFKAEISILMTHINHMNEIQKFTLDNVL